MTKLTTFPLVYLATPYTKYPTGIHMAFVEASRLAAMLMRRGVKIYSPIAHTHPLALYGNIDPLDHDVWLPFDRAMMDAAGAVLVAMMDGWDTSYGVTHEIGVFRKAGKPVFYLDPLSGSVLEKEPA